MSGLESTQETLTNAFKARVEEGLSKLEASESDKEILRKRLFETFNDNAKRSLAVVFGKDGNVSSNVGAAAAADLDPASTGHFFTILEFMNKKYF